MYFGSGEESEVASFFSYFHIYGRWDILVKVSKVRLVKAYFIAPAGLEPRSPP